MSQVREAESCSLARNLAPEDIRRGDYVATMTQEYELPSFCWDDCISAGQPSVVRLWFRAPDAGKPYRVKEVCLPFVYVSRSPTDHMILDVRATQLARLDDRYAKAILSTEKQQRKSRNKKSKRKQAKKRKK